MNPRELMRVSDPKPRLTPAALNFFQQGFHIEQGEQLEEGPQVPKAPSDEARRRNNTMPKAD